MKSETDNLSPARIRLACAGAYLLAWLIVIPLEIRRWEGVAAFFIGMDWDSSPFVLVLLIGPLAWWLRLDLLDRRYAPARIIRRGWRRLWSPEFASGGIRPWVLSGVIGATSIGVSMGVAGQIGELPPGYHDEYSYLFQAKTFLAGRVSFPSHEAARLFDQMHVLNEGRFASRYFPGTGLWMAPFVAAGKPYWGHWLAGAICSVLVFWTGRELAGDGVGAVAGGLTAVSPGMALFSNLLLAHHPTLVGLALFLFGFIRMTTRRRLAYALIAGAGLTFAMLCRPMTAAGFALPFGVALLWWVLRGDAGEGSSAGRKRRFLTAALLGAPLMGGLCGLFFYNRAITGDGLLTPYQQFTDIYTPRHGYGFNNVVRGEKHLGPRVLENYDRWAEEEGNLTHKLALRNAGNRLLYSTRWTLGVVPTALAAFLFVVLFRRSDWRWWLILFSIVSLHAVHVPYWYVGIMHWHYVFETGPLWALLFAAVTGRLFVWWQSQNRPWLQVWWVILVLAALLPTYLSFAPYWTARISNEIVTFRFGRLKQAQFRALVEQRVGPQKAIVLVEADPADRHIDYVVNNPDLSGNVLFARYLPEQFPAKFVHPLFADRAVFLYRARTAELKEIP